MIGTEKSEIKSKIIVSNGKITAQVFSLTVFFIKPCLINLQYVTTIKIINHTIDYGFWASFDELDIPKCTHLAFEKCTFPNGYQNLYSSFSSISIVDCGLTDEYFDSLFHFLNQYALKNLDLRNNNIGQQEQDIQQILQRYLPDIFIIRTINFSGNPMKPNFIKKLQEQYKQRTQIIYDELPQ